MKDIVTKILGCICGLAIVGGAACAWRYWQIDGFVAVLIAFGGMSMIGYALER